MFFRVIPKVGYVISFMGYTPLKFNIELENKSLENDSPIGNHYFQVPYEISEGYLYVICSWWLIARGLGVL